MSAKASSPTPMAQKPWSFGSIWPPPHRYEAWEDLGLLPHLPAGRTAAEAKAELLLRSTDPIQRSIGMKHNPFRRKIWMSR
ncbi:MAG: hypothetical protein K9N23_05130 [Akkermansiaceae bacterium]|nr:hypothetical protein [Akkermansiaceae bacterium]MCF7731045.1 hypothetical protein [Akkermansiaceae bacterium]